MINNNELFRPWKKKPGILVFIAEYEGHYKELVDKLYSSGAGTKSDYLSFDGDKLICFVPNEFEKAFPIDRKAVEKSMIPLAVSPLQASEFYGIECTEWTQHAGLRAYIKAPITVLVCPMPLDTKEFEAMAEDLCTAFESEVVYKSDNGGYMVATKEGAYPLTPGCYLISGTCNEQYPVDAVTFGIIYESDPVEVV